MKNNITTTEWSRKIYKNEKRMHSNDQMQTRYQKIYKGIILGNHFNRKVKILFNTEDGVREISSHVWAITDRHVVLYGGLYLPISAVVDVIID